MKTRGWTSEQMTEAIQYGKQIPAVNKATGNPAVRYVYPSTGQSVVVDSVTNEVVHVGARVSSMVLEAETSNERYPTNLYASSR